MKPSLFAVANVTVRREVHHFLHQAPHQNRGVLDQGWNCRDHALLTALLVHWAGHPTALMHGKAMFLIGPRGGKAGFGIEQKPHSWGAIENMGLIDLSIKKEAHDGSAELKLPFEAVFANETLPRGRGEVRPLKDEATYQRMVAEGSNRPGVSWILYVLERGELLDQGHIVYSGRWINSSLTDELKSRYGDAECAYAALFLHLIELCAGNKQSFSGMERWKAWGRLMESAHDPVHEAISRVQARLPLSEAAPQGLARDA